MQSFVTSAPILCVALRNSRPWSTVCAVSNGSPNPSSPTDSPSRERDEGSTWSRISLPPGAVSHPSAAPRLSSLQSRLQSLSFGYERDPGIRCGTMARCARCPVRYLCPRGHVVTAVQNSPAARGCPMCSLRRKPELSLSSQRPLRAKHSLDALRAIAANRGGFCLAIVYESARIPVEWSCSQGHRWFASVDNVKSKGSWCPECAKKRKKCTLQDMREMAAARGGECLSEDYQSGLHKLRWRCAEGHEFEMAPNNIKRLSNGTRKPSWCPLCRSKRNRSSGPVRLHVRPKSRHPVLATV